MPLWIRFLSVLSFLLFAPLAEGQTAKKSGRKKQKALSLCEKKVKQGVKGMVYFQRGNQMPSPDSPGRITKGKGVARRIAFFELTKVDQAEEAKQGGFFKNIKTRLIKETRSNAEGCFVVSLPPGKYSMMVWEEGYWYANSYSGDGQIMEVEVKPGDQSLIEFRINHAAFY
jgi:hypothetical protein